MTRLRTVVVWVGLTLVLFAAIRWMTPSVDDVLRVAEADELRQDLADGRVMSATVRGDGVRIDLVDGMSYLLPAGALEPADHDQLLASGIPIAAAPPEDPVGLAPLVITAIAVVLLAGLAWVVLRRLRGGATNGLAHMTKSKARLLERPPDTRFTDVGGCDDAKARLVDLVDFLKHPEAWEASGARIPRGVLLEGPPGTGKTHLARAVAGEAGVRFFVASGSEFVELLIGVGAARVRDLFESAAKVAPAVIFIDELDAIGRRRGSGAATWNEERELTLNQLLVAMDGFARTSRVVVIGATNRADILDPALVRPGRFDVVLTLPPLDEAGRRQVLAIHARGKPLAPEVDLDLWARRTAGATGAVLEQLLNEAALHAVRHRAARGAVRVGDADLQAGWDAARATPGALSDLDRSIVGSAWHLVRPDGRPTLRATLTDGRVFVGALVWADSGHLKLDTGAGEVLAARSQIVTLEPGLEAP